MDTLTIIQILSALSFIILTVSETIVLAANGWKVDKHKTPAYDSTNATEFCKGFWSVMGLYLLVEFVVGFMLFVLSTYVIGWFYMFNGIDSHEMGLTIGITILLLVGVLVHLVPKLFSKIFKSKPVKAVQQTKLSQGVYNWYHQFKNKYCPILERD